jgi:putative component of membrane protein insertase Oxa1/YidC/SpoIIIJ protein YidD
MAGAGTMLEYAPQCFEKCGMLLTICTDYARARILTCRPYCEGCGLHLEQHLYPLVALK